MTYQDLYNYISKNITDENLKATLINKLIQIQAGYEDSILTDSAIDWFKVYDEMSELWREVEEIELLQYAKSRNAYTDYINSFLIKKTDENTKKTETKKYIIAVVAIVLIFWLRG